MILAFPHNPLGHIQAFHVLGTSLFCFKDFRYIFKFSFNFLLHFLYERDQIPLTFQVTRSEWTLQHKHFFKNRNLL